MAGPPSARLYSLTSQRQVRSTLGSAASTAARRSSCSPVSSSLGACLGDRDEGAASASGVLEVDRVVEHEIKHQTQAEGRVETLEIGCSSWWSEWC